MKPFHFMLLFWGQRYRDYFVDLCLPSLLAPNNLPLLRMEDGHRFFIATTEEDWQAIAALPIMSRLRQHAEPILIKVSAMPSAEHADKLAHYAAIVRHQETCFRPLLEAGYDRRVYGSLLGPDIIVSDNMVKTILNSAKRGDRLVVRPALRQVEESVLSDLNSCGLLPAGTRLSRTADPLTLPPRFAAHLGVRHLHPELTFLEDGAVGQPFLPPYRYWRMPRGRGLILHTFFGLPVLMDYTVFPSDHTACLKGGAVENVYISANLGDQAGLRVIQDSDDFNILSLTPEALNYAPPPSASPDASKQTHYERLCSIRRSMEFYARLNKDFVKRDLFRVSVRWNACDIDDEWRQEEQRIDKLIMRAVGDYYARSNARSFPPRISRNPRYFLLDWPILEFPARFRGIRHIFRVLVRRARGLWK